MKVGALGSGVTGVLGLALVDICALSVQVLVTILAVADWNMVLCAAGTVSTLNITAGICKQENKTFQDNVDKASEV